MVNLLSYVVFISFKGFNIEVLLGIFGSNALEQNVLAYTSWSQSPVAILPPPSF